MSPSPTPTGPIYRGQASLASYYYSLTCTIQATTYGCPCKQLMIPLSEPLLEYTQEDDIGKARWRRQAYTTETKTGVSATGHNHPYHQRSPPEVLPRTAGATLLWREQLWSVGAFDWSASTRCMLRRAGPCGTPHTAVAGLKLQLMHAHAQITCRWRGNPPPTWPGTDDMNEEARRCSPRALVRVQSERCRWS